MKRKYTDPYIVIARDMNQWDIEEALLDFLDLKEVDNDKSIDKTFTNMSRSVVESGTLSPLESEDGVKQSDHKIAFCKLEIAKLKTFSWQTYTYRHYSEDSVERFKEWVVLHDWREVLEETGSNNKAEAYQWTMTAALERFSP